MCKVTIAGKKGESHIKAQDWASIQANSEGPIALTADELADIQNNLSLRNAKPQVAAKAPEVAKPIDFCTMEDVTAMLPMA